MAIDSENQLKLAKSKGEEARKLDQQKTEDKIAFDNAQTKNKMKINEQLHQHHLAEIGKKEQAGAIRDTLKETAPEPAK